MEERSTVEHDKKAKVDLPGEIFEWIESIVFSVIAVILLFTFLFRIVGVDGESMLPTLNNGDRLIVTHIGYEPKQGDVIVVSKTQTFDRPIVKRVIATEGQQVDIDFEQGTVYVDGQALQEDYILEPTTTQEDVVFPVQVPEGHVFVMGDNRNNSSDSRNSQIGMIDERYILGKVVFRLFPFDQLGAVQ